MAVLSVTHEQEYVQQRIPDPGEPDPSSGRAAARGSSRPDLVIADLAAAVAGAALVAPGEWPLLLVMPVLWFTTMYGHRAHERVTLGSGPADYRRVVRGAAVLPALAAAVAWGLLRDPALFRALVLAAVPAAALSLGARFLLRRRGGTAVVVGTSDGVVDYVTALGGPRFDGASITGVCLSDPVHAPRVRRLGLPVLGGVEDAPGAARTVGAGALVVLPVPGLDAAALRRLHWGAADAGADFLIAPPVHEAAASRLAVRTVGGVPLIQVRAARVARLPRLLKDLAERLVAAALLLLLAPVMVAVAAAVRLESRGPALFRQQRVGLHGRHFTMLKFRTMRVDAEALRAALRSANHNADGLLFKVRNDPRITRVGAALRKYSIDELPQLINVLWGRMSLVGPRPSLPEEAERYGQEVRRRLLVKPGVTGLWQVSGRSDLPWVEAVRLDLSYVDNWSLGLDARILLRTGPAVMRGTGAY
ncbi:hypothetical protein SRB5_45120 [Streptomyces sp. RB5]|uniref:Bacterial sugar transferase domain-containing protein n=1 Tax=Streptomyces smaragdinus TaxID=2585196 RepID=A0A7K0CLI6_9ACTN|nr:exopolysaccharide biosynthesis polyprenyl glycosylphosphotransferase [Streptomyces smaragdinus]MQY14347.1 hypothetical protein [Streptomyces smaragdinus]